MAAIASAVRQSAKIYRVDKRARFHVHLGRLSRVVNSCVANIAVVAYHLAGFAEMISVMAAKAARGI